jgi:hypothetical protein
VIAPARIVSGAVALATDDGSGHLLTPFPRGAAILAAGITAGAMNRLPEPDLRLERRASAEQGGTHGLTVAELALLASCGEPIRGSDWPALRRAGLAPGRAARWFLGGTALLALLITRRAMRRGFRRAAPRLGERA